MSRYGAEFARHLAESLILPFDARDYATAMKSYVQLFDEKQGQELRSRNMGKELGRHLRLLPPRLCYQGCPGQLRERQDSFVHDQGHVRGFFLICQGKYIYIFF